ncbi:MAG: M15 family metallopeptidase [Clostridiales bacterium]|jgi:peptidoglycan L-alanyl-D-glutamate endopeptidase CwlK|nr:M15 family metallopeptidase [Clostridiales bacterium]
MIDSRDVNELHPALKRGAAELMSRMKRKGYDVIVTSSYRDNESQNALYEQGRTKPGSIVTNARGGESVHNYRLAFDIAKNIKGQEYSDANFFITAGNIWREMGGEWGGDWVSFPDKPHMQYTGGLSIANLKAGSKLANDARMPWESVKEENKLKIVYRGKTYIVHAFLISDYYHVRLREFAEIFGAKAEYIEKDGSVILTD